MNGCNMFKMYSWKHVSFTCVCPEASILQSSLMNKDWFSIWPPIREFLLYWHPSFVLRHRQIWVCQGLRTQPPSLVILMNCSAATSAVMPIYKCGLSAVNSAITDEGICADRQSHLVLVLVTRQKNNLSFPEKWVK